MQKRIPNFPDSKRLSLDDKEEIENFVQRFPPYSDYNFTSLYCYNVSDKVRVSWLNDNLVVLFQDYTSDELFFSFLGDNLVSETALTLLDYADNIGITNELRLIPDFISSILNEYNVFKICEDNNSHDYILSVQLISNYSGGAYNNKRTSVNKFQRTFPKNDLRLLDLANSKNRRMIIDLFSIWISGKKLNKDKTLHELNALERLLDKSNHFAITCFGVFVEDELVAFSIEEFLDNKFVVIHFEKSNPAFDGVSAFMRQAIAKYLHEKGITHINYEQDLGIEGLRVAKELYRPTTYLKKFIIAKECLLHNDRHQTERKTTVGICCETWG